VQRIAMKTRKAECWAHVETARDGHAVEERVKQQPDQRRRADRSG
jgi:hypothetical protein